ncbi:MAG: AAA family ATPase [Microcoleus vaginatus WJT46-NPBG5]|jgi:predicted ATP-binding protein involved in virulence|nr:AAA family ATPase [Microcoleus vaginatus WJT46-NPBG5]
MINQKIQSNLESFSIFGLFGTQKVVILFKENAVIIIGENGSGKTTLLNAIYYTLSCKFYRLMTIDFESIVVKFKSGDEAEIAKSNLILSKNSINKGSVFSGFLDIIPEPKLYELLSLRETNPNSYKAYVSRISRTYEISSRMVKEYIENLGKTSDNIFAYSISTAKETIEKNLKEKILYFPTYRRIEEDLNKLVDEDKNFSNVHDPIQLELLQERDSELIRFGMTDVDIKFKEITSSIKNSAIEWFSKVTGEMLSQLVDGISIEDDMKTVIKQPEDLKIVLGRVGDSIPSPNQKRIIELIETDEIFQNEKYNPLIYFLSNLIKIYEQQREKDESIKKFAKICNEYLRKKKIVYNESTVEISVVQTTPDKTINLQDLSSGEKQIISLFSRIYLDPPGDFILLFDEPELSLSIEWQRKLLPDILKSGKCKLLLSVTHSPFIFDNELDENAFDLETLKEEIEEKV